MNSFLEKQKTKKSYEERISTEPIPTRRCKMYAVKNFEHFILEKYDKRTLEEIIEELVIIRKKEDEEKFEEVLYDMLQEWINWNEEKGRKPLTIRVAFSNLRKYLFFRGIKTNEQDVREYLRFPKIPKEERHPLSLQEYRAIVDGFAKSPLFQAVTFALGSSGMRIGELMRIKKKHLDITTKRIKVTIPPHTKTRAGRTAYFSNELKEKIIKRLEKLNAEDYVFCKYSPDSGAGNYRKALSRLLKRLELDEKYQSNNILKISPHSFRAFFFTKAARKHGENYAHRMIGHGGYLMQYDRMTEEEKLDMYIELEPELAVFDQTKNQLRIENLEQENASIEQLREELKKLQENQAKQDKKIVEGLRIRGVLPENE